MAGSKKLNTILMIVLVASLALLFVENISAITGKATSQTTTSNVTIEKFLSINMGQNLADGIDFGNIEALPTYNQNATHNYDGAGNTTQYFINVSTDSNTNVTFCTRANAPLTSSALDTIPLENETMVAANINNETHPGLGDDVPMTTTYTTYPTGVPGAENIGVGEVVYYRFYLDVDVGQATGNYNNTVSFKGVTLGSNCLDG